MIDLRNLETFVWVARLGGFRLAAERLNTTQPAISARISLLEQDLGVRVFERRPRRVALTQSGIELLGYAERILLLREELLHAIGGAGSYRNVLRIGVPETVVHTWMALLVERIAQDFSALTVDIEVDSSPNLRAALSAEKLDVVITQGPCLDEKMASELLCSYPLAWFARAELALPKGKVSLADVSAHPIVTFRRGSPPYVAIRSLLNAQGLIQARMFGSSSIAGIVRMALDGIGTCVLPPAVVQNELREGKLRMLSVEDELPTLDFYVNFRKDPASGLARAVGDLAIIVARSYLLEVAGSSRNFIGEIQNEN